MEIDRRGKCYEVIKVDEREEDRKVRRQIVV